MAGPLHRWDIPPWIGIPLLVSWLLVLALAGITVLGGSILHVAVALVLLSVVSVSLIVLFRRGVPLLWRAASLLAIVACVPVSHTRGEHRCIDCGSEEHAESFGWGIQDDLAALADVGSVVPSHACKDFFDPGHEHRWLGHGRIGGAFFINGLVTDGSIYCGMRLPSAFARRYEESPIFRDEVKRRIEMGEATREEIRRLVALDLFPRRDRPLPKGTHALLLRAGTWLGEPVWPHITREQWPPEGDS